MDPFGVTGTDLVVMTWNEKMKGGTEQRRKRKGRKGKGVVYYTRRYSPSESRFETRVSQRRYWNCFLFFRSWGYGNFLMFSTVSEPERIVSCMIRRLVMGVRGGFVCR